jgi:DNA-3-methyladenine glycosylase
VTRRLSARFYRRPIPVVARALLGKVLVRGDMSGVIVETEAYLGPEDAASHARFTSSQRNRLMFGRGGVAYVYLCYGIHDMFNVVAGREGEAGAVLIRALAPHSGFADDDAGAARGPGKLCKAMGIDRSHNGADLIEGTDLFLTHGPRRVNSAAISRGPRIGVDYAGAWADEPLRFWLTDHPAVSRRPRKRARG